MAYGDVYDGLKSGAVDGAENSFPSYEAMNHYKEAKYYIRDGHSRIPEIQIVSARTMEKLTETDRQILRMCAAESAKYERELWLAREKDSEKKVTSGGTVVTELTPEEKAKFVQAVQPIYEKYGSIFKDLVQRIKEVQ